MKLTAKAEIQAPIDTAFAQITDANQIERTLIRRGATVRRCDSQYALDAGAEWQVQFDFRGKPRDVTTKIVHISAPETLTAHSHTPGFYITTNVDLVALSKVRTRLVVTTDIKPRTVAARLILQGLRLTRNSVENRFHKRIKAVARAISC